MIKPEMMVLLMLGLFLISSCAPPPGRGEEGCPPIAEPPADFCSDGQTVQYTKDEQGCFTQMQCGDALPFDNAELSDCLNRCDETEQSEGDAFTVNSYNYCKAVCYTQRAAFTGNVTDCRPILNSAQQYSEVTLSGGLYNLYFDCMVDYVGVADPSACDVAQDNTNYPYCINKIAIETGDAAVCDLVKRFDLEFNFYYNSCVQGIQRG